MARGQIHTECEGQRIEAVLHDDKQLLIRLNNHKELAIEWIDGEPVLKQVNVRIVLPSVGTMAAVSGFGR